MVAKKSKNTVLNDIAGFCKLVTFASTRLVELLSKVSESSNQISRATTELRQARDTVTMQSKDLVRRAQLKMFIKSLEDNVAFYEASEDCSNSKFARRPRRVPRLVSFLMVYVKKWLIYKKCWVQWMPLFKPLLKIHVQLLVHPSAAWWTISVWALTG